MKREKTGGKTGKTGKAGKAGKAGETGRAGKTGKTGKPGSIEVIADGTHLRFVRRNGWEFVERKNVTSIAILVAVTAEDRVLVVEQYREPVGGRVLELPAGLAGDEGAEEAESAANRELVEETGYRAGVLEVLTDGPPSPGLSDEIVTIYLARRLTRAGAGGGVGAEEIEVHEVPFREAFSWLEERRMEGRLVDPKVYGALALAARRMGRGL